VSQSISEWRAANWALFLNLNRGLCLRVPQLRLHVGYGDASGGVMSEVLAKREEEIGRMQAHFANLEAELRLLRHEKVVYQKVLPPHHPSSP
jgi:hypothetical protein